MATTAVNNQQPVQSQDSPELRANVFYAITALVIRMLEQAGQASQLRSSQTKELEAMIRSSGGDSAQLTKTIGNVGLAFAVASFAATAFATYYLGQAAIPLVQCLTSDKMGNAFTAGLQRDQRLAEAEASMSTSKYNNLTSQTQSDTAKNDAKQLHDQAARAFEAAARSGG